LINLLTYNYSQNNLAPTPTAAICGSLAYSPEHKSSIRGTLNANGTVSLCHASWAHATQEGRDTARTFTAQFGQELSPHRFAVYAFEMNIGSEHIMNELRAAKETSQPYSYDVPVTVSRAIYCSQL
jgi:hypothetical protein